MATSAAKFARPLRLGTKQVFLPNFTITLTRNKPQTPATHASFIVPLNLNKLDLRDYLFNVYNVRVLGVRSYIQQQKVRQDKPGARRPKQRKWYRPRAIKKMIVEMEHPFEWPEETTDLEAWDKKTYDAARDEQKADQESNQPTFKKQPSRERESIAEQASRLLDGTDAWKSKDEWEDVGEEVEVEQDVVLPRQ
ncbi:hypothetical protein V495_03636 [Pseudogymnoascus sp. VKM F-4514 (FW-929)]|nr:hypothetical protein V495_03636 [Pseudogymnoascus sp. VKM F-4514 (FW-929)]KFY56739.1 hypothetical protein V497_06016 [Pseudogymnoascus sp. VKM F-4516 (FW-969)]